MILLGFFCSRSFVSLAEVLLLSAMQNSFSDISCDIVIPYHAPAFQWVFTSVDSVLNQQNANCVIHIVGDAVDQKMHQEIIDRYRDAPDVYFYRNEDSLGPFRSLHKVFHAFKTPYSAFQASDDISLPHRIHYSVSALRKNSCEVFTAGIENFIDWKSSDSEVLQKEIQAAGRIQVPGPVAKNSPSGRVISGTMVIKNSTFLRLNGYADWFCGADTEFAERAYRSGASVCSSDIVVLLRRMHIESLYHGKSHGLHTDIRKAYKRQQLERFALFEGDFDPRAFGSLDKYLTSV